MRDDEMQAIYSYKDGTWIGWDDLETVQLKVICLPGQLSTPVDNNYRKYIGRLRPGTITGNAATISPWLLKHK